MDCSTTLNGSFCYVCGQREQRRVASLHSLVGEYVSGVLDWDSRVWRTLWPLFTKPGYLTKLYMEGKRERHSPPIRLYLISSIIFFLMISIAPRDFLNSLTNAISEQTGQPGAGLELGIDSKLSGESFGAIVNAMRASGDIDVEFSDDDDGTSEGDDASDSDFPGLPDLVIMTESPEEQSGPIIILDRRDVVSVDDPPEDEKSDASDTPADTVETVDATALDDDTLATNESTPEAEETQSDNVESDDLDLSDVQIVTECEELRDQEYDPFFEFLRMPAYRFCQSVSTWRGLISFVDELMEKLPTTLFILLPLMAFVNKLLYLFSRRYYVEHLLYYVHNYSFLFLFTALLITISTVLGWLGIGLSGLLSTLGTLYVIYYFLKSIRVVYGQGYFMTISKWLTMLIAFFILASIVLVFFLLGTAAAVGL